MWLNIKPTHGSKSTWSQSLNSESYRVILAINYNAFSPLRDPVQHNHAFYYGSSSIELTSLVCSYSLWITSKNFVFLVSLTKWEKEKTWGGGTFFFKGEFVISESDSRFCMGEVTESSYRFCVRDYI